MGRVQVRPTHQIGQELGLTKLSSSSHQGVFTRVCPDLCNTIWIGIRGSGNHHPNLPGETSEDAMLGPTDPHKAVNSMAPMQNTYSVVLRYYLCVNTLARCTLYRDKVYRLYLPPAHTHEFRSLGLL